MGIVLRSGCRTGDFVRRKHGCAPAAQQWSNQKCLQAECFGYRLEHLDVCFTGYSHLASIVNGMTSDRHVSKHSHFFVAKLVNFLYSGFRYIYELLSMFRNAQHNGDSHVLRPVTQYSKDS